MKVFLLKESKVWVWNV